MITFSKYTNSVIALIITMMFCLNSFGQKADFHLAGRVFQPHSQEYVYQSESNVRRISVINDSTTSITNLVVTREDTRNYTPKLGAEVLLGIDIQLNEIMKLSSGFGFSYNAFSIMSSSVEVSSVTISSEIGENNISTTNPFGSSCIYTNDFSDLEPVDREPKLSFVDLTIPLLLSLDAMGERLKVNLGAYLSTPLFSTEYREYITVERDYSSGSELCTWVRVEENNRSGNSFRNAKLAASIGLEFRLTDKLSFLLDARKSLSNVLVSADFQSYPLREDVYKPMNLSLGIKYKLGKSNKSDKK